LARVLTSIAASEIPCKCCGAPARLFGVVDLNKNCEDRHARVLELSGVPVYYHRCAACGFIFTAAFDHYTPDDFRREIYNQLYVRVDPDYAHARPQANAAFAAQLLGNNKSLRLLDYGGGNGLLAQHLQTAGYDAVCYDPLVPGSSARPEGQFDCIFCFEVVEHSPTPQQTIADIASLLRSPGIIVFSTLFSPAQIEQLGVNWWYIAPRNGHVSLFTSRAMQLLTGSVGLKLGSFTEGMHVLFREIPPFAQPWFAPRG
jgi:SAM-dependent methyltransferase